MRYTTCSLLPVCQHAQDACCTPFVLPALSLRNNPKQLENAHCADAPTPTQHTGRQHHKAPPHGHGRSTHQQPHMRLAPRPKNLKHPHPSPSQSQAKQEIKVTNTHTHQVVRHAALRQLAVRRCCPRLPLQLQLLVHHAHDDLRGRAAQHAQSAFKMHHADILISDTVAFIANIKPVIKSRREYCKPVHPRSSLYCLYSLY